MRLQNIFNIKDFLIKNPENVIDFGFRLNLWKKINIFNDNSCLACFPLNGNTNDLSNKYSGEWIGTPKYENCFDNRLCASFDKKNYIKILVDDSLRFVSNLSYSVWVKISSLNSEDFFSIITFSGVGESKNTNAILQLLVDIKSQRFIFFWEYGMGKDVEILVNYDIPINKLLHLVVSRDSKNKILYFYVNGELIDSISFNYNPEIDVSNNKQYIALGADAGISNPLTYPFNGEIGQFRIFNKILSFNEVKYLYKNKC